MAQQTLDLGSGFTIDSGNQAKIRKNIVVGPIDEALVEDSNDNPLNTSQFSVNLTSASNSSFVGRIIINLGSFLGSSEDLTTAWETYSQAVTLEIQGGSSVVAAGPNHPNSLVVDPSEPYSWRPSNYLAVAAWADQVDSS